MHQKYSSTESDWKIPLAEWVRDKEIWKKMPTESLIIKIGKGELKLLERIMTKDSLENVTRHTEDKRDK